MDGSHSKDADASVGDVKPSAAAVIADKAVEESSAPVETETAAGAGAGAGAGASKSTTRITDLHWDELLSVFEYLPTVFVIRVVAKTCRSLRDATTTYPVFRIDLPRVMALPGVIEDAVAQELAKQEAAAKASTDASTAEEDSPAASKAAPAPAPAPALATTSSSAAAGATASSGAEEGDKPPPRRRKFGEKPVLSSSRRKAKPHRVSNKSTAARARAYTNVVQQKRQQVRLAKQVLQELYTSAQRQMIRAALRCQHLVEVALKSMPALVDDDVQQLITKYGSRLQRLELDGSGVTRPVIDALLLQQLSLARCQGLLAATVHSPQLVELDLSHTFINSSDLGATIKSLQQLVVLRLHGCRNIDSLPGSLPKVTLLDVTRTKFTDTSIAEAVEGCPALTSLLLATCSKIVRPTLKSSSLETLTMYQCKNLAEPTLTGCDALQTLNLSETPIAGAAFIRVFAQVPHLKSLAIANCHDIVDTPLLPTRDSGSASYSLTSLDARMCGIMDSSLSELAQCLPNLRYLNIRQCFNVAGGLRLVLPQLETLILQSSRIPPSCISQITGSGCPQLRTLNCRGCLELSGEGICGPQLVSLDLSSTAATGPALRAAVGACPNLKHFAASQCNDLVELTVSHPTLQRIFLDYNRSLAEITIKCPALTHMGLQGCWRLTKAKLEAPQLETVTVTYVPKYLRGSLRRQAPADTSLVDFTLGPYLARPTSYVARPPYRTARQESRSGSATSAAGTATAGSQAAAAPQPPSSDGDDTADSGDAAAFAAELKVLEGRIAALYKQIEENEKEFVAASHDADSHAVASLALSVIRSNRYTLKRQLWRAAQERTNLVNKQLMPGMSLRKPPSSSSASGGASGSSGGGAGGGAGAGAGAGAAAAAAAGAGAREGSSIIRTPSAQAVAASETMRAMYPKDHHLYT